MIRRRLRLRQLRRLRHAETLCEQGVHEVTMWPNPGETVVCRNCKKSLTVAA